MAKVSVIIPIYNSEEYLRECLDSVVNQTLKDIEIICIDDGSTDNSLKIINEYKSKDERIKVFSQANQGAAIARNIGIEEARGDYLLILDSDDIFHIQLCEKLYDKALETDADITICNSINFDSISKEHLFPNVIAKQYLPNLVTFDYKDIIGHVFDFTLGWSWDKLYKTSFVKKHNLQFQNLKATNDMYFVFLSLVLAEKISIIEDSLIEHRLNNNNSVSSTRDKNPFCFIEATFKLKDKLEKLNIYKDLEQAFVNWNVEFCFWHLDTLKENKNKKMLANKLKKEVFPKLRIYSFKADYFYNISTYNRIHCKNLLKNNKWYQNIFSIKNEKQNNKIHKVITVFGINFKFLKKTTGNNEVYIGNYQCTKKQIKNLNIEFIGNNNIIKLGNNSILKNCKISMGSNNFISVGDDCFIENVQFLITSNDCTAKIGNGTIMHGGMLSLRNKTNTQIMIGERCLFSDNILLLTSDGLAIYDNETLKLINPDGDIIIGNNVWICSSVTILKNTKIADNCVIGTRTVVTQDLKSEYSIYAGIPARKIKSGVMWNHISPEKYNY